MLIRVQKWFVVLALVLSIGGHWAFLQSVAWVGMAMTYSKHASLSQALEKTFDGHHLCKLCKIVRAGKKAEDRSGGKMELKKFDLIGSVPQFFLFQSPSITPQPDPVTFLQFTEAPALPPPLFA